MIMLVRPLMKKEFAARSLIDRRMRDERRWIEKGNMIGC